LLAITQAQAVLSGSSSRRRAIAFRHAGTQSADPYAAASPKVAFEWGNHHIMASATELIV
jgi:hypothetical protein